MAFEDRENNHLAQQPFGQVPFLSDGELEIFESGACLLHLARKNSHLIPSDPVGDAQTVQWIIAALNSIEMVTVPWWFRFTAADLLMADVLRVPKVRAFGDRPATERYVARVTNRPAFKKAYDDQLAHFAPAD